MKYSIELDDGVNILNAINELKKMVLELDAKVNRIDKSLDMLEVLLGHKDSQTVYPNVKPEPFKITDAVDEVIESDHPLFAPVKINADSKHSKLSSIMRETVKSIQSSLEVPTTTNDNPYIDPKVPGTRPEDNTLSAEEAAKVQDDVMNDLAKQVAAASSAPKLDIPEENWDD